jgi:aryl-alcohol dehydrogenase-like predicted oxidoreductase
MQFTTLGRTGLRVSVAGLGCGGPSRLGLSYGRSEAQAADVVRAAIDQGVNLIDTARYYETEGAIGAAIQGRPRDSLVLCTKTPVRRDEKRITQDEIRANLEQSLIRMRTDAVDVFYLHGVKPYDYNFAVSECLPIVDELRQAGKIRFIGITESFSVDKTHEMLGRATREPHWDVVMTGFNILNQTARARVFPETLEKRIGTTVMFAVRRAFSRPERLREILDRLVASGHEGLSTLDRNDPLGFLERPGGALSLPDAAYRFCRHEPGVDCVLFGTGNIDHIATNITSILRPPLPDDDLARLRELFGQVDTESGS